MKSVANPHRKLRIWVQTYFFKLIARSGIRIGSIYNLFGQNGFSSKRYSKKLNTKKLHASPNHELPILFY